MEFCREFFDLCVRATNELGFHKSNAQRTYTNLKGYLKWKYSLDVNIYGNKDHEIITRERIINLSSDEFIKAKKNPGSRYGAYGHQLFKFGGSNIAIIDKVLEYLKEESHDNIEIVETNKMKAVEFTETRVSKYHGVCLVPIDIADGTNPLGSLEAYIIDKCSSHSDCVYYSKDPIEERSQMIIDK